MKNRVIAVTAVCFLILLGTVALRADDEPQPGVARVSLIHGDVSMQRGDSGDWVATSINTPLVAGDWLATGKRSRTEVQLDYANVLRLSEDSEAKIADLSRTKIQVQVRKGLINFDVFKGTEADVEIDTPNMAVRPVGEGQYRVFVISDGETQVIVRKGEADVTTPQGSTTVKKGQLITIRGRENPEYQVSDAPDKDAWDNWNKERDSALADARSYERTNRYYTGAGDLDNHGHWAYINDYGWAWTPIVGPGWAPYRYGRWVWEPYWGWTWVSYEPWGWAPYHYGRWFLYGASWYWWPGPVYPFYRPIWAPAYVSFFGWGGHFGFSFGFGFGNIGWLPIGPRDYYYPWWGRYRRNFNVVNITNITNITNVTNVNGAFGPLHHGPRAASNIDRVLTDARIRRGMTSMSGNDFGRVAVPRTGRPVIRTADLRQSQVVRGNLPVVPTRESLRPVDRPASRPTITRGPDSDRFFTRSQPTFRPQPFHTEASEVRDAIQQHQGNRGNGQDARPGVRTFENNRPGNISGGRDDAQASIAQAGAPQRDEQPGRRQPNTPNANQERPGWRRFGDRSDRPSDGSVGQTPRNSQAGNPDQPQARGRQPQSPDNRAQPRTEDRNQPRAEGAPSWRKFEGQTRPPGRDNAPSGRGVDRGPGGSPRRESSPGSMGPRSRSADTGGGDREFRPFTPQPERERSVRSESVGGDRSGPSRMPDRSMGGDRSSGSSRFPDTNRGMGGGRPSADRGGQRESARPPLEMRRPIVEPRAPAGRQGGGSRGTPPSHSSGQQGGGSHSGGRPPGGRQR